MTEPRDRGLAEIKKQLTAMRFLGEYGSTESLPSDYVDKIASFIVAYRSTLLAPIRALVENIKRTRTAWLEQHGVPISQEFVDFANAIGELEAAMKSLEGR